MESVDYKDRLDIIKAFLEKYDYSDDMKSKLMWVFFEDTECKEQMDVLYQIYTELNLIPRDANRYFGFIEKLTSNFDINQNILEVGGGDFPIFAKELSARQVSGSITVYEPDLVVSNLGKLHLVKDYFTLDTNTDNYDLLIGIHPCSATELLIRKANSEHKEFFLALCGCDHSPWATFFDKTYTRWENYIYDLVERTLDDNASLEITTLDDKYKCSYPILMKKYIK